MSAWFLLLISCATLDLAPADTGTADVIDDVARAPLQLALPLTEPDRFYLIVGVDHDPAVYEGAEALNCRDFLERGFPHCYDEHDGSDFMLSGSFQAMDAGSTPVVAAADGVVVDVVDGNYDRCHGSVSEGVDCDGYPKVANRVIVEHATGDRTWYLHLKKDSVAVDVDQQVVAGEELGLVGSSGNSSAPHLHFEVQDGEGEAIDPFAGPGSQDETFWCTQGDPEGLPGGC